MAVNLTFNERYAGTLFPTAPITPEKKLARIRLLQQWNLLATNQPCGNDHAMRLERRQNRDGWRWKCHVCRNPCRTQGLRVGTFFEGFDLDIGRLAYAIYLFTLRITGKSMHLLTGISENYIVRIRQKIRLTCLSDCTRNPIFVDGSGGWTV